MKTTNILDKRPIPFGPVRYCYKENGAKSVSIDCLNEKKAFSSIN